MLLIHNSAEYKLDKNSSISQKGLPGPFTIENSFKGNAIKRDWVASDFFVLFYCFYHSTTNANAC